METIPGINNWLLTARRDGGSVTLLRCATPDVDAVLPETLWELPVTVLADHALAPRPTESFSPDRTPKADNIKRPEHPLSDSSAGEEPSPLSAERRPADGQTMELRITCGSSEDRPWDNAALRTLSLPPELERVENYALYHCRALERLRLHDGVSFWGSGVLTGCPALQSVEIIQSIESKKFGDKLLFAERPQTVQEPQSIQEPLSVQESQSVQLPQSVQKSNVAERSINRSSLIISPGGTLAYFAGELNQELDVTVSTPDGPLLRLILPAYRESYEENTPAHHFDYVLEGAGYPYHHCFRSRILHLPTYDSLWPQFQESGDPCAVRLAWWRVRYPAELSASAEAAYWTYLRSHAQELVSWLMQERDIRGLAIFLGRGEHGRDLFTYALDLAREQRFTEAVALLLEEQHRRFPIRNRFVL